MSCDIPPIEASLAAVLQRTVDARSFTGDSQADWTAVSAGLRDRMLSLATAVESVDPEDARCIETRRKIAKIRHHLLTYFASEPPFTVVRLAEIVCDPAGEGYTLDNAVGVYKYVNALHKLVFVTSRTSDYPEPVFRAPQTNSDTTELVGKATEEISLVRIPWLDEVQILESPDDSESSTEDENGKHKLEDSEQSGHKKAKLNGNDAVHSDEASESEKTDDDTNGPEVRVEGKSCRN